jgi:hypothetical protein
MSEKKENPFSKADQRIISICGGLGAGIMLTLNITTKKVPGGALGGAIGGAAGATIGMILVRLKHRSGK